MSKFFFFFEKNKDKKIFNLKFFFQISSKDTLLDSNLEPNFATFLFEADIEKYLRMTETIEAIFEALPMCIL
jgi:hypothetical protein